MNIQDLHQQLSEPIILENGVLMFDFSFDTDNGGWLDVYDNQMGINILKEWEYSPPTMTLTIKLGNPFNRIKQITC